MLCIPWYIKLNHVYIKSWSRYFISISRLPHWCILIQKYWLSWHFPPFLLVFLLLCRSSKILSSPSPVPNPSPKSEIQSLEERDWGWGWQYNTTGHHPTTTNNFSHLKCQSSDGKRPSMIFIDLHWPSLSFHGLPWPSMTFYDLLSPSKTFITFYG